jgi:hypothetical protein
MIRGSNAKPSCSTAASRDAAVGRRSTTAAQALFLRGLHNPAPLPVPVPVPCSDDAGRATNLWPGPLSGRVFQPFDSLLPHRDLTLAGGPGPIGVNAGYWGTW